VVGVHSTVSPMDRHGWFLFGFSASLPRAAMSRASNVFLEVDRFMSRTHGTGLVHISEVDTVCGNHIPLIELGSSRITEKDECIGNFIAEHIPDDATIQFGIGSIPNAVSRALKDKKTSGYSQRNVH
jgi:4-hydroxybutyrate CoA-transferase